MDPDLVRNEIHRLTCEINELREALQSFTGEPIGSDHHHDSLSKSRARKFQREHKMRMPDGREIPDRQS